MLGVCLFVPVMAGLYARRVGQPEALAAVAAGIAAMVAVHLATRGRGFGIVTPAFAGIALSVVGCAVMVLARRRRMGRR